jgi:hypothetical protein
MESRTTRFESERNQHADYTSEMIANSGWMFDAGEATTSGNHGSISVTATNKTDGRIHKMHYSVTPNLSTKAVDIFTSYVVQDGAGQILTAIKDEFTMKASIRWGDILPWVAATRERHESIVRREHGTGVPAKIGVSFFLPLVWDAFKHGREQMHERKSAAKDRADNAELFD